MRTATPTTSSSTPTLPANMVTLHITLHSQQNLALAMPETEWKDLVQNFARMPADERQRIGHSIRSATAHNPFPQNGEPLTPAQQQECDTFVSDCILLVALAQATSPRVFLETALQSFQLTHGNLVKPKLN